MSDEDALREALAVRGWELGERIGAASSGDFCDAPGGGAYYMMPGGGFGCRCMICSRCGHHTGNSNQGHYWRLCKVTRTAREFHYCCDDSAYGCELEAQERLAADVTGDSEANGLDTWDF